MVIPIFDELLEGVSDQIIISTITEMELFSYRKSSSDERQLIAKKLHDILIVPVDSNIARYGAFLRREYGLKTMDALIAATAVSYSDGWLWSYDRVFDRIPELKMYQNNPDDNDKTRRTSRG